MRRPALVAVSLVALAAGCGGGSDRLGSRPEAVPAGSQGPSTTATPQATDGRLGDAVVARPGGMRVTGHQRRLPARLALPPSNARALGAEQNCADADVQPSSDNLPHVSDVIFCLMNAMRENNGLPDLTQQTQLAQASLGHSQDMVANSYFAHDSPDGRDVVARLKAVRYIRVDGEWVVGENLVWGSGALATPRALVNAWMNSPPHRENLLSGDYKEVGMGVAYGTPDTDNPDGITVTTDFGTRSGGTPQAANSSGTAIGSARSTASRARNAALRRCNRRRGSARRRCVRAARHLHR